MRTRKKGLFGEKVDSKKEDSKKEDSSSKKSKSKEEATPFKDEQKYTRRSSLKKVKPIVQNPLEFLDTMVFDVSKVMEVKKSIRKSLPGRIPRELKNKSWGQNIVEQIILFYKVIIFHQDCVKIVLELIHNISSASDTRLDEILARLKEQVAKDKKSNSEELQ